MLTACGQSFARNPKVDACHGFSGEAGAFLGQIRRGCPTLSRRPPWRCIGATMVTSTFAEFEASAYGELAKPPQLLSRTTARFETRRLGWHGPGMPPKDAEVEP